MFVVHRLFAIQIFPRTTIRKKFDSPTLETPTDPLTIRFRPPILCYVKRPQLSHVKKLDMWRRVYNFTANDFRKCLNHIHFSSKYLNMSTTWSKRFFSCAPLGARMCSNSERISGLFISLIENYYNLIGESFILRFWLFW